MTCAVALAAAACRREAAPNPPPQTQRRDLELTDEQAHYLDRLAAAADASPGDFGRRKASGMAHMRFTLSGALAQRDRTELDLEAAFRIDSTDRELTRSLGRFYNLRAVAGDYSKADIQVEVYRAHLGDIPVDAMTTGQFVSYAFSQLGAILAHKNRGQLMRALGSVKDLEAQLAARAQSSPDDIELHALAGNFAFFFAGNIPFGRKSRVAAAVAYFTHVRKRWEDLRPGARDPDHCPNTYENFMFELAEGHVVLGQLDPARVIYEELTQIRPPVTRAKEQIAFVSNQRLKDAADYVGDLDLMPPWPSDVGNCVVCHAYTSDVPLTTLTLAQPISLDDIPTSATPKPVPPIGPLSPQARATIEARCNPCHFRGGEAQPLADFSTDEGILARARAITRRVAAGEMPPEAPLSPEDRTTIRGLLND